MTGPIIEPEERTSALPVAELVCVLAFLGILTVAAWPLFHDLNRRSRVAEAARSLRVIRLYEREYEEANGRYLAVAPGDVARPPADPRGSGLKLDFTENNYFGEACFSVELDPRWGFLARCDGDAPNNDAPHASRALGIVVELRGADGLLRYSFDGGEFGAWRKPDRAE